MFILFGQSGLVNRKKEISCHQCFQPPSLRLTLLMGTWQAFSHTVPHFKGYHLNMEFFIPIPVFKQGYAWVWKVTWEVNFILMIPRKITRWKNLRKIVGLRYDVLRPGVSPAWCSIDINIINFTDIKYMLCCIEFYGSATLSSTALLWHTTCKMERTISRFFLVLLQNPWSPKLMAPEPTLLPRLAGAQDQRQHGVCAVQLIVGFVL